MIPKPSGRPEKSLSSKTRLATTEEAYSRRESPSERSGAASERSEEAATAGTASATASNSSRVPVPDTTSHFSPDSATADTRVPKLRLANAALSRSFSVMTDIPPAGVRKRPYLAPLSPRDVGGLRRRLARTLPFSLSISRNCGMVAPRLSFSASLM